MNDLAQHGLITQALIYLKIPALPDWLHPGEESGEAHFLLDKRGPILRKGIGGERSRPSVGRIGKAKGEKVQEGLTCTPRMEGVRGNFRGKDMGTPGGPSVL